MDLLSFYGNSISTQVRSMLSSGVFWMTGRRRESRSHWSTFVD